MSAETVLTDAQIFDCFDRQCAEMVINFDADELYPVGRAIEQAVLQSPGVQAWKRDAERYRAWRKAACEENREFLDAAYEYESKHFDGKTPSIEQFDAGVDYAIDAAMESKT